MKRLTIIFFILCVVLVAAISWYIYRLFVPNTSPTNRSQDQIIQENIAKPKTKEVVVGIEHFNYSIFTVPNTKTVLLLPNFKDKASSLTLKETYACTQMINGGFYDKQGNPLGLFITNGQTYTNHIPSALLNGFFSIDRNGHVTIDSQIPDNTVRIALQSGPLLFAQSQALPLRIQNDEHARRMIAATTENGNLVFITLYTDDAVFEGPLLADVPAAVGRIDTQEKLGITTAINLDGGSASAFYSDQTTLSEFTPVGSMFCTP